MDCVPWSELVAAVILRHRHKWEDNIKPGAKWQAVGKTIWAVSGLSEEVIASEEELLHSGKQSSAIMGTVISATQNSCSSHQND